MMNRSASIRLRLLLPALMLGMALSGLRAQDTVPRPTDRPVGIPLGKEAPKTDPLTGESEPSYIPRIDGVIKARFEVSTYDGQYRFNVRNARLGLSGNASRHLIYRLQVDFCNEGKTSVLDAYAGYRRGGWEVTLGQQRYQFSSDLGRNPAANIFANRSLLSKFLTTYYGADLIEGHPVEFVRTVGSRDLGALATYTWRMRCPLKFFLGVFNGSGINNPEWSSTANVIGRIEAGPEKGLRASVAYYDGTAPRHNWVSIDAEPYQLLAEHTLRMVGGELRYDKGNLYLEGEYARRYLEREEGGNEVLVAAYLQGYYRFPMRSARVFEYIAPTARWDMGNGLDYLNLLTRLHDHFSANRMTLGLNFGFGSKMTRTEIRLNYETYFFKDRPTDLFLNKSLQDKFTVEIVAAF